MTTTTGRRREKEKKNFYRDDTGLLQMYTSTGFFLVKIEGDQHGEECPC